MSSSRLRLVVVKRDGTTGAEVGAIVRDDDGTFTFEGPTAEDLFATITRVTGGQDKAWAALLTDGWSNSHLTLQYAD